MDDGELSSGQNANELEQDNRDAEEEFKHNEGVGEAGQRGFAELTDLAHELQDLVRDEPVATPEMTTA